MKLIKWFILILIAGSVLIYLALKVPQVQIGIFSVLGKNSFAQNLKSPRYEGLTATVCGSGSPLPSDSAQACIMIQAEDRMFIVDVGDGSVRNLSSWRVPLEDLKAVLITHLHSDHFSDLADLHLMSWVARDRSKKLTVFGPEGIENVTKGFELAYTYDSLYRNEHHGDIIAPFDVVGYEPFTLQGDSVIYDENDLKITAFLVSHKPVDPAYGFRFDYKGRSIVISGDTIYDENLIKYAKKADLLFHEAISYELMRISSRIASGLGEEYDNNASRYGSEIFRHIEDYHTTPVEAAMAASKSDVGLLVFYHLIPTPQIPIRTIMAKIFFRGVTEVFPNWEYAIDGTTIILPPDSDEIIFKK